jgi:hypothetical protein
LAQGGAVPPPAEEEEELFKAFKVRGIPADSR